MFSKLTSPFLRRAATARGIHTVTRTFSNNRGAAFAAGGLCAIASTALYSSQKEQNTAHSEQKTIYGLLVELHDRMDAVEAALGVGLARFSDELKRIGEVKKSNPNNLAMKYFDVDYFSSLGSSLQNDFINIVRTGFENADSGVGCCKYAHLLFLVFLDFVSLFHFLIQTQCNLTTTTHMASSSTR